MNSITLGSGWKVDLARHAKQRILRDMSKIDDETLAHWAALFARFEPVDSQGPSVTTGRPSPPPEAALEASLTRPTE